ncbi:Respiratory-chain NADH dehydrogenase 24 Kd subunit superfamily [Synechococcus sp. PCC 7335]|uniref:bidirectional hydrogenase complex protein HoxE n=1 Tax=Synechococcus sp. (strain ATCC 29403 / PCC 7335) TaxID=91464 RepID=UPI00017ED651|nr:bidirectional hydrogenase complex protein HoxE [Synechococcus sp. PCC 7335]EDX83412.1 Respiratory-chain NADH dehydrogenase 24 Kd subunit superfamily [Synechococcus sp. PCC 7335]
MPTSPASTQPTSTESTPVQGHSVEGDLEDKRWQLLAATMKRHQYRSDALIEVLHKAQELFDYLSPTLLAEVAKSLQLPLSQVYGVATFYHFFSLAPSGHHSCTVCLGTACYVKGAAQLLAKLEQRLGIQPGQTTADGEMSLSTARCLGACGIAPVVVVDDAIAGHQTTETIIQRIDASLQDKPAHESAHEFE